MEIRISMLGLSGAGKTSFMSGIYHHFVNDTRDNEGFSIRLDSGLKDRNQWANVASVANDAEFPNGSVVNTNYKFDFDNPHLHSTLLLHYWFHIPPPSKYHKNNYPALHFSNLLVKIDV